MRCITCDYSLKRLTEHRCPECGRSFDPNDQKTFESGPKQSDLVRALTRGSLLASTIRMCVASFVILVLIVLCWAIAGLVQGFTLKPEEFIEPLWIMGFATVLVSPFLFLAAFIIHRRQRRSKNR